MHWQREFYLDATRWEVWLAPLVIVGIAIPFFIGALGDRVGIFALGLGAIVTELAMAGGWMVSRNLPQLHRRMFRRAWWIGVMYWMMGCLSAYLCLWGIAHWLDVYGRWIDGRTTLLLAAVSALVTVSVLMIPLWRLCW